MFKLNWTELSNLQQREALQGALIPQHNKHSTDSIQTPDMLSIDVNMHKLRMTFAKSKY